MFELNKPTKMTIFYQKTTGIIKCIADYETTIENYFVNKYDRADYELIWDSIVVAYNENVLKSQDLFKINLKTKEIILDKSLQQI